MRTPMSQAKTRSVIALAVAAALSFSAALYAPAAAAADKKEGQTVSRELAKPLKGAQDDLNNKKFADAITKLKEADGNAKKTPYDQHLINEMLGFAYVRTNDYAQASKYLEASLNDGQLEQAEVPKRVRALAQLNYQLKNYDKAIEFGNRAIKGGFADAEMETLVGQAYYLKGDWKGTLKFERELVEGQIKEGKAPKKESLDLMLSSCVKLEDDECQNKALEREVQYYPKPEYWQQLLYTQLKAPNQNDKVMLQTYRLMSEVDSLKRPEDYTEMAQIALDQGSPGEAQRILEKAFQKNVYTDQRAQDKNKRLLESAKKAATADQAALPKLEKEAEASPTGDKDVGVGIAWFGYQQYDKAIAALTNGIQKGGMKAHSDAEAKLLLGIAQFKAGKRDEAQKSWKGVKGDANLERIATLWSLRAKERGEG